METGNKRQTRLQKLSGSDFEIVDGQPDIRGWDVRDSAGKQLGEVGELIFDYESRKVRYLVVDLDENEYDLEDKEVLVPIGITELHEADDDVILPGVSVEQMRSLPEYNEERFDTEHESSVRNVFGGLGAYPVAGESDGDNDFYNHEHFNERNLYRNRDRKDEAEIETAIPLPGDELQAGIGESDDRAMRLRSSIIQRENYENIDVKEENSQEQSRLVNRNTPESDLDEVVLNKHGVMMKANTVLDEDTDLRDEPTRIKNRSDS